MTFAELKTETFRRLEESSSSPVFWSEEDVEEALNEAYREVSDETEWNEIWRTVDLYQARPYYDVRRIFPDVHVLSIGPAYVEDTNRWLIPTVATDLDRGYSRWEQVRATPERLLVRGLWWLSYWPYSGSDTGTVKQYATVLPDPLSDDEDEPGFEAVFHTALVDFAVADLLPQAGEVSGALEA